MHVYWNRGHAHVELDTTDVGPTQLQVKAKPMAQGGGVKGV